MGILAWIVNKMDDQETVQDSVILEEADQQAQVEYTNAFIYTGGYDEYEDFEPKYTARPKHRVWWR